ncbi:MAG TPA: hypothetical protein VGN90_07505 [Pyrinomonadaceae bacterium]|jgi:hypothetical protein|nr:hypothetical protein [Pyrinomonadaceae bacterium]
MDTPETSDKTNLKPEDTAVVKSGNGSSAPSGDGNGGLPIKRRPVGGLVAGFSGDRVPSGLFTTGLGLGADVSREFDLAPTFGDVLLSIGTGIADSQAELDRGVVDTAQQLSNTKIDVITDVIQRLDDDGLPDVEATELIHNKISLINFVNPTVHEWKHVSLSMDLSVGAIDKESGMSFSAKQTSDGTHLYGLFWGFLGWFDTDSQSQDQMDSSHSRQEVDFATGQVRMDALLAPRRTTKFPIPAQITIGPSITFSQGSVQGISTNGVVTGRSLDVLISVRKADGSGNPNIPLEAETDRFAFSWITAPPFPQGSQTNADGLAKLQITRDIPNPAFARPTKVKLSVRFGAVTKDLEVIL